MKSAPSKPRLLLDICCAPDACYVARVLSTDYAVTGFFNNAHIEPKEEYDMRREETGRLFRRHQRDLVQAEYDLRGWHKAVRGREDEPEGHNRCVACFEFRLDRAARYAREKGFDVFTTTLTISPHKKSELINRLGQTAGQKYGVPFLAADFKKRDGFIKSIALAKAMNLHRQDYCGCGYSLRETRYRKLMKTIRACAACRLSPNSHPIVSGRWTNRMMLVGQAPGKKELALGMPFSGPAGKRLFRWLSDAGIDEQWFRRSVHMTAVMKCFPGSAPHGDRKPNPAEVERCSPYLEEELQFVRPRVLVPVGQMAIERFLGKKPLDRTIGRRFTITVAGGECAVIPLPHPSGASPWSYQRNNIALLAKALRLIKKHIRP